jgi:hypothetical protein
MKTRRAARKRLAPLGCALLALGFAGCGKDTRVNSDPMAGKPSQAESGSKAVTTSPEAAQPKQKGTDPGVGTDSSGRPSDASGGTTSAGSGSQTSGTITEKPKTETRR